MTFRAPRKTNMCVNASESHKRLEYDAFSKETSMIREPVQKIFYNIYTNKNKLTHSLSLTLHEVPPNPCLAHASVMWPSMWSMPTAQCSAPRFTLGTPKTSHARLGSLTL